VDSGQDTGTLRVTIREAAARLGVTEAAIRKRIQRGSLGKELGEDGRVYVYLDLTQDMSHPESQLHRDPLVEGLRGRVRFLEDQLQQSNDRDRENRRIIAALTSRIPEIEAPASPEAPEAPGMATEQPGRVGPQTEVEGPQEGAERPWWRRMFGG
jgi:hypothetical protein